MGIPEGKRKTAEGQHLLPYAEEVFSEDAMDRADGPVVFSTLRVIRQLDLVSIIVGQPASHGAYCKGFR